MPRTDERESSSRRSRSRRSRSRHRTHQRGHHRSRTRFRVKYKEKNFASAICNMISIVILCTALAEPKWISMKGGGCMVEGKPLNHLGTYQFFYPGKFLAQEREFADNSIKHIIYQFGPKETDLSHQMDNCVTYKAALLFKTVITFCFLAISSSLVSFILDLTAPKHKISKILRRNAILCIVTVILTVVVNLFCYWLTVEIEKLQKETKLHHGSKVIVDFDISFYLVTAAGALSILATAFNCLRRYPVYEETQAEPLIEDYEGMDPVFLPRPGSDVSAMLNLPPPGQDMPQMMFGVPPPPAYTP